MDTVCGTCTFWCPVGNWLSHLNESTYSISRGKASRRKDNSSKRTLRALSNVTKAKRSKTPTNVGRESCPWVCSLQPSGFQVSHCKAGLCCAPPPFPTAAPHSAALHRPALPPAASLHHPAIADGQCELLPFYSGAAWNTNGCAVGSRLAAWS